MSDGISFKCGLWELDFNSTNPQEAPLIFNTYDYRIFRPLVAYFKLGPGDHRFNVFYTITPVNEDECSAQYWLKLNNPQFCFFTSILYKNCILQIHNYVLVGALPLTF